MRVLNVSSALSVALDFCKQGEHTDLVTLVGLHSIADNETVKWCYDCGSVIFTVLEGLPRPDMKPRAFTHIFT
jgi:hypothetical protein